LARQAKALKEANPEADKNVQPTNTNQAPARSVVVANFDPNNPEPPSEAQLLSGASPAPSQGAAQVAQAASSSGASPSGAQAQQTQPSPADIEHQLRSLQGRFSQKDEENRRMAQQVADLNRLLASVASAPVSPSGPNLSGGSGVRFEGPITGAGRRRITPKEEEEFGKDLIDLVGRRAMEVQEATLAPVLGALQAELNGIKQALGGVRQVQVTDATQRLWDHLDREIPNWQEINTHPEFVRWLQVPDPLSGQIRHGMLKEAFDSQQVGRVQEFFRRFLADQAALGLQGQRTQPGNGGYQTPSPQVDLMTLAAPGRAKPGQTTVTPEKPTYSRADISAFYHDKTFGKYTGREAEAAALERDMIAASTEGRIRG
jgi:hypothetical protein